MANISREEADLRTYIVYRHRNKMNGKVYIGITSTSIERRSGKNGQGYCKNTLFYRTIKKYGWDNFEHEILYSGLDHEDAANKEIELISEYNSTNPNFGYNLSAGGFSGNYGRKASDELKKRFSEMRKGERNHWYGIRGEMHPSFGREVSEETRKKIGLAHKGKIVSDKTREMLSNIKHQRGDWSGDKNPMYGKRYGDAPQARKVLCEETGIIYDSIKEAAEDTGCFDTSIAKCCKGKQIQTKGFHWKYIN